MKSKLLLALFALSTLTTFSNGASDNAPTIRTAQAKEPQKKAEEKVYICTGKSAKRYHRTSNCRGLNRCSGKIVSISKSAAEKGNRTPCKICY